MMAKITKGHDFGGAVRYVTQEKKDAKLLDAKGVLTTDKHSIINLVMPLFHYSWKTAWLVMMNKL